MSYDPLLPPAGRFGLSHYGVVSNRRIPGGPVQPQTMTLEPSLQSKNTLVWTEGWLFGSWVWPQTKKQGPPWPSSCACGWVPVKPLHKGPLWCSAGPGLASPSGSRKMFPVWQLPELLCLGRRSAAPRPGLLLPGVPRLLPQGAFGSSHNSRVHGRGSDVA